MIGGKSVIGSIVGTRNDLADVFALHAAGRMAGPVLSRYVAQVPVTAPFFAAVAGDPVEAFVAEAPRHPDFALGG